jgi:hypothetical protein
VNPSWATAILRSRVPRIKVQEGSQAAETRRYKVRCDAWDDFKELFERAAAAGVPIKHLATAVDVLFEADDRRLDALRDLCGAIDPEMVETIAYAEDFNPNQED